MPKSCKNRKLQDLHHTITVLKMHVFLTIWSAMKIHQVVQQNRNHLPQSKQVVNILVLHRETGKKYAGKTE